MFVEVVLNLPINSSFTYSIPDTINETLLGKRVIVNFRGRKATAYVINQTDIVPEFKTKDIIKVVDKKALFEKDTIDLATWISDFYLCSLGEALSIMLPKEKEKKKKIVDDEEEIKGGFEHVKKGLLPLNDEQENALKQVIETIEKNEFRVHLLYGVTGSGKTEVYKYIADYNIKHKKTTLILVPEIALTPQTIERFKQTFGNKIAVLHSRLTPKERLNNFLKVKNKEADIILGARSAIFVPNQSLGAVIIDEEHESTYKSNDTPRYHARQLAYKICQQKKIPLVLGSATPSLETYHYGIQNNINLLVLAKRHSTFEKQDISLVDMRKEKGTTVISAPLIEKISEKINKGEQVILFLNKRGFANFLFCPTCGFTYKCPHCDITLTYHMQEEFLLCHYCGYKLIVPLFCASCNNDNLRRSGYGTEKVEETLNQLFTENTVIARMDSDTMKKRTAYEKIFTRFKNREINILIGTQMIAKGLHYPNVTLVGIIMADVSLNLPDFRASERSYSLLTQVSGRAGRGNLQGEVLIQTYQPEHYVIQTAKEQNFHQFYEQEIRLRRQYFYPPFSRLIKLLVRGKDQTYVRDKSMEMFEKIKPMLNHYKSVDILGPAPCPIQKINDNYRWQMILRGNSIKVLGVMATVAREYMRKDSKIYLEIDVDPVFMG